MTDAIVERPIVPTEHRPDRAAHEVGHKVAPLLLTEQSHFCTGCGEPIAARTILENLVELGVAGQSVAVLGIGCYTAMASSFDIDTVQALHGRAPSVATGVKRMKPDSIVFTLQGDGDMVNEGLQEVLHTAARGESVTAILLNNGVFGETGGHMTATSVLGQRTKNTIDGRDAEYHGYPIRIADLIAQLDGVAYVARGSVHSPGAIAKTKKMVHKALQMQVERKGFSFVEILTMCPTGWFIPTIEGPQYMDDTLGQVHTMGELEVRG
jgi:2-oxoglutarate ferredoxin oxidoreductase subunit beta